jgi:hypothetical protein
MSCTTISRATTRRTASRCQRVRGPVGERLGGDQLLAGVQHHAADDAERRRHDDQRDAEGSTPDASEGCHNRSA